MLMPNKVPQELIKKRKQEVLRLTEQLSFELRDAYVGKTVQVLTESIDESNPDTINGHTSNFLPVQIHDGSLSSNQLVDVELIENSPVGLIGRVRR
jgi:threonylcarbamoyladenosine tRNA methylthiotransferase MtaB